MNGYLRLTEFVQVHGFWLDSRLKLRCGAKSVHNLGRWLVQKSKILVVREHDVRSIARLIDEFGLIGTPIYPLNIILFPNATPWLDIQNVAYAQRVAICRPHVEEDEQSGNELIAAHDLLLQFSVACQEMMQSKIGVN